MSDLVIICVDDQSEVLAALLKSLTIFEKKISVLECQSVSECNDLIESIYEQGQQLAIVISDHIMPEKTGIDFLIDLHKDDRFINTRKVLLTGLASHKDTIDAINQASIHHYIEKPWNDKALVEVIKRQLTYYVMSTGIDYRDYQDLLDANLLFSLLRQGR